jgi:hypothetical protein
MQMNNAMNLQYSDISKCFHTSQATIFILKILNISRFEIMLVIHDRLNYYSTKCHENQRWWCVHHSVRRHIMTLFLIMPTASYSVVCIIKCQNMRSCVQQWCLPWSAKGCNIAMNTAWFQQEGTRPHTPRFTSFMVFLTREPSWISIFCFLRMDYYSHQLLHT